MNGIGHKAGWAWIFILEGLFTVLFGIASFWLLPRSPAHAYFFSQSEKNYVVAKLKEDGTVGRDDSVDSFSWSEVKKAFMLPQVWFLAVVLFCDGRSTKKRGVLSDADAFFAVQERFFTVLLSALTLGSS